MNMADIIAKSVHNLQGEFDQNPSDFVYSEREAQVRLYCELQKHVKGTFFFNDNPDDYPAVPRMCNQPTVRLKLEWPHSGEHRHDIVLFKKDAADPKDYGDVEAFIEVKTGWGADEKILSGSRTQKDFALLSDHPGIGYLVFFVANQFSAMEKSLQDFYLETLDKYESGHVYMVFRDRVLPE